MKIQFGERKNREKRRDATTSCYNAVVGWASAHPVKIPNESAAIVLCLNLCSEHLCFTAPRDSQALSLDSNGPRVSAIPFARLPRHSAGRPSFFTGAASLRG